MKKCCKMMTLEATLYKPPTLVFVPLVAKHGDETNLFLLMTAVRT